MSTTETEAGAAPAAQVNEWEPHGAPERLQGRAVLVVSLVALIGLSVLSSVWPGGVLSWGALATIVLGVAWVLSQRWVLLARALPANGAQHSRLLNLASGLASDLGMKTPRVLVSPEQGANAFVVPGVIVVTEDLLSQYTRTELEAVIAHCLVRLRDGGLGWAVTAAGTGGHSRVAPRVDERVDARTAALTRYPPALASAIRKASPRRGRTAALWFVAHDSSHAPAEQRAAALLDL